MYWECEVNATEVEETITQRPKALIQDVEDWTVADS